MTNSHKLDPDEERKLYNTPIREAAKDAVNKSVWKTISSGLIIVVITALATLNISQGSVWNAASKADKAHDFAIALQKTHERDIAAIEVQLAKEESARREAVAMISRSIDRITASLDKQTEQNTKLISLVEVQNRLIQQLSQHKEQP